MTQFEIEVSNALRELGIMPHLRGHELIKAAENYLHEHPEAIHRLSTELYPAVAEKLGTTPSRVERNIRQARTTSKADDPTWYSVMGRVGPMTNAEFLASLNEAVKIKMAMEGKV